MKYEITDLEIESIYYRIKSKDIDLQPDFQRGEVWTDTKKKKLIDTILRGWQIPPIHLIEKAKFVDEVLDGQQRLVSIRDFMNGTIKIDGNIKPLDEEMRALDGLTYNELDNEIKRKFKKFSIRLIRLTEYKPEEPAELFYRLNQPATLTSAEQRNAFIGEARNQVKELVRIFETEGASKNTIGFSNSRMAYDDIISKLCYILEIGTLKRKITSNDISDKFRSGCPFNQYSYEMVEKTLVFFARSVTDLKAAYGSKLSLNKATLFSWLLFVYRNINSLTYDILGKLIFEFESIRDFIKGGERNIFNFQLADKLQVIQNSFSFFQSMILLFNQKASMGSTDATAIIIRDIILEVVSEILLEHRYLHIRILEELNKTYNEVQSLTQSIEIISRNYNWGGTI